MLYRSADHGDHNLDVAYFRLLWGSRNVELESGAVVLGRSDECELRTDDPLVSRQHARFEIAEDRVTIEDVGSRNGIIVNGNKITQRTALGPGDTIRIGSQSLTLLYGRTTGTLNAPSAPTRRLDALGVVGELSEKAVALGRFDEAERLLDGFFQQLVDGVAGGEELSEAVVAKVTDLATRLAVSTLKPQWIDRLILLYLRLHRPWPAEVVDSLYGIAQRVSGVDRTALRNYVSELQDKQLGPADRFLMGRIAGLERQLAGN